MLLGGLGAKLMGFRREDRIAVLFGSSQKTLPIGVYLATSPEWEREVWPPARSGQPGVGERSGRGVGEEWERSGRGVGFDLQISKNYFPVIRRVC